AVPKHINIEDVRNFMLSQKEVENIHDLHIWAMSTTQVALTVHLKMSGKQDNRFIIYLQEQLRHKFKINHTTFQIENAETEENCSLNH
ncbi:MAG: cation transporter, partial [Bacteroidales bacterium]|nr:cation transporter [Bacteroidales bacterium]